MRKKIPCLLLIIFFSGCTTWFHHPATMQLDVPEGPPEFKAGWYDGCRSALSIRSFANSMVYNVTFGNGIYQGDSRYQLGWSLAMSVCNTRAGNFKSQHFMKHSPLQ